MRHTAFNASAARPAPIRPTPRKYAATISTAPTMPPTTAARMRYHMFDVPIADVVSMAPRKKP